MFLYIALLRARSSPASSEPHSEHSRPRLITVIPFVVYRNSTASTLYTPKPYLIGPCNPCTTRYATVDPAVGPILIL